MTHNSIIGYVPDPIVRIRDVHDVPTCLSGGGFVIFITR